MSQLKRKVIDLTGARAVTVDGLLTCDFDELVGSCGEDIDLLARLCEASKVLLRSVEDKVKVVNAVTRKCSVSGCTGSGLLQVERCQCQHFRLCSKCADEVHYNTDEEKDSNDEEEDDNEMDRESRDADGQRDKLDESGAARCVTCQILLCEGCMNDANCEYCGGAMCKRDALTSRCKNTTYCEGCEGEHECPDCDICDGYASY